MVFKLQIKSEFDIRFWIPSPTAMIALLHLHPSIGSRLVTPDVFTVEQTDMQGNRLGEIALEEYTDTFGNLCSRFDAPVGNIRLSGWNITENEDYPEQQGFNLPTTPVSDLPEHTLQFLLASRYCEVDKFNAIAQDLFGQMGTGWALATAIRDWVHDKVMFNYKMARSTKTAMDVYTERIGVCRDFQHLAVTLTRCMNIPARYVTGYIGDIRRPFSGQGDFSAWYQVWLGGKWWDIDARHNHARMGRLLMAVGRDAADVAITTSFGRANLTHFFVESNELGPDGEPVPIAWSAQHGAKPTRESLLQTAAMNPFF